MTIGMVIVLCVPEKHKAKAEKRGTVVPEKHKDTHPKMLSCAGEAQGLCWRSTAEYIIFHNIGGAGT